ncbi:MAG: DUF3368 domain-containing protein [Acidobacteriota bacterium]
MSSELWAINASPLIALARVGQLALLELPGRQLLVPKAVVKEVRAGAELDPARVAIERGFGGTAVAVTPQLEVLEWGLGTGESAVLTLARLRGAVAVIDDGEARSAARALGVRLIGTLGVVLLARQEGRIASASQTLRTLRQAGFYLDDNLLREALARTVGESWEP